MGKKWSHNSKLKSQMLDIKHLEELKKVAERKMIDLEETSVKLKLD